MAVSCSLGEAGQAGTPQNSTAGAGFFSSPTIGTATGSVTVPSAFVLGGNGGRNGSRSTEGGFGGGGAEGSSHGAGGGGYSGGGATGSSPWHGGGGGSFNAGADQDNAAGVNAGHGTVVITRR